MAIYFNSLMPEYSWLSNFSPHAVGNQPTAEHAYQASKFVEPEMWKHIRSLPTAREAKRAGSMERQMQPDWPRRKISVMASVLRRKFQTHPDLKQKLLDTGDEELVHYCPWGDTFWGVGSDLQGKNWQGKLLMQVRDALRH